MSIPCALAPSGPALLIQESTFILILIINSSAYGLYPSAAAQAWKHLRLTHYKWDLAFSSHHETNFSLLSDTPKREILTHHTLACVSRYFSSAIAPTLRISAVLCLSSQTLYETALHDDLFCRNCRTRSDTVSIKLSWFIFWMTNIFNFFSVANI